ncbi:hypothetical protein [Roseateles aquatilis]|nr:hypothetical protein [Roseateles aquatilis]
MNDPRPHGAAMDSGAHAGATAGLTMETVSQLRLEALMSELTRRVMVVQPNAIDHLVQRGVLAPLARDGCCKPDGGTCCPNAKRLGANGPGPVINPGLPGPTLR